MKKNVKAKLQGSTHILIKPGLIFTEKECLGFLDRFCPSFCKSSTFTRQMANNGIQATLTHYTVKIYVAIQYMSQTIQIPGKCCAVKAVKAGRPLCTSGHYCIIHNEKTRNPSNVFYYKEKEMYFKKGKMPWDDCMITWGSGPWFISPRRVQGTITYHANKDKTFEPDSLHIKTHCSLTRLN